MSRFERIIDFFKENKKTYIIGIIWLFSVDIAQLILPRILGNMTDALRDSNLNNLILIKYASLILLTGIFTGVGRYFWRMYISGNSVKLEYKLRKDFFNHLLYLSPNYFYTNKTGDLMSHATNDISTVRRSLGISTIMLVDSLFIVIIALFMMIKTTSLKLTLITSITFPIILFITKYFGKIIYKRSRKVQNAFSTLTEKTQESYSGIRVIKAFSQEEYVFDDFKNINKDYYDKNLDLVKVSGFFTPSLNFVFSLSILFTILFGGTEVINGNISLGDFIAFNSYVAMLRWPVRSVGQITNNIQRGIASLDRLNEIFYEESEIIEKKNPIILDKIKGNIEFKNVFFQYPNTKNCLIKDVSFKLTPGNTLAIIGPTGSGKTTIANLLLRLYDYNSGLILIDNIDIKDLSLKQLRTNIAYVPQDNFLFSKSIKENISFSQDELLPMNKIVEASVNADLYDNIINFNEGFETILGERGVTLSGGQKQRTSIARAFAKDAPILILDDSLSAVDTKTEETILRNINSITKDKSTIIISHRISSIKNADQILFLDNGRIIESGTHEELLNLNGSYKKLHDKQQLDEDEKEAL